MRPTMHIFQPILHQMKHRLDKTANGKQFWRSEGKPLEYLSIYSGELCSALRRKIS